MLTVLNGAHVFRSLVALPLFFRYVHNSQGTAVAQLVEALLYKPEGRGFDFRWCNWNF